jgi:RNA polymerase sigma-70 factor (ECF subfamily)
LRRRCERQYLKDIRQGRREACKAVISQNYKSIYRFVLYLTGDSVLSEDLTQETFVSAWTSIDQYTGRASLKTWLHRIAYHKFIDSKRALERRSALMAELKKYKEYIPQSPPPLHQLISDENSCCLWQAIYNLQTLDHIVIVLHYIQGFSFSEMAKVLDQPGGTVKWRTNRALKKLKAFLSDRV